MFKYIANLIHANIISSILFITIVALVSQVNANTLKGHWIHSEQLTPGMKILTANNKVLTVAQPWELTATQTTTYNFEVENNHTYFVSKAQLWNHNMTDCEKPGLWQRIKNRVWGTKEEIVIPHALEHKAIDDATNHINKLVDHKSNPTNKYNLRAHYETDGTVTAELYLTLKPGVIDSKKVNDLINGLQQTADKFDGSIRFAVGIFGDGKKITSVITRSTDGAGSGGIFR